MFDEEPHEERCPEGLLHQCCKHEGHKGECDDFSTARAVMAEKRVRELEAEVERLQGLVVEWILEHGCQCVICARAKEQHQAGLFHTPEGSNASGGADDSQGGEG